MSIKQNERRGDRGYQTTPRPDRVDAERGPVTDQTRARTRGVGGRPKGQTAPMEGPPTRREQFID